MEDYPGQWLERRVRNLNLQPDVFPNELDGQRIDWGPPPPELGRRSDVVPEEQPVQLASIPDVSIYRGGNVFNDVVGTDFLTQAAEYTGPGNGILAGLGPYTGLAGLAENDPFPTTALFEGFDPSLDLSSMYA
jgi:hypothetical protein